MVHSQWDKIYRSMMQDQAKIIFIFLSTSHPLLQGLLAMIHESKAVFLSNLHGPFDYSTGWAT